MRADTKLNTFGLTPSYCPLFFSWISWSWTMLHFSCCTFLANIFLLLFILRFRMYSVRNKLIVQLTLIWFFYIVKLLILLRPEASELGCNAYAVETYFSFAFSFYQFQINVTLSVFLDLLKVKFSQWNVTLFWFVLVLGYFS